MPEETTARHTGPPLLPEVFEELNSTLEELRVAEEEMRAQNEELILTRARVEAERQRYQDLFEFAPSAYLVTTPEGKILAANRAVSQLLNIAPRFLKNRMFAASVFEDDLHAFYTRLSALTQDGSAQAGPDAAPAEWTLRLRRRQVGPFEAALAVSRTPTGPDSPHTLRWLVQDITARREGEQVLLDELHAARAEADALRAELASVRRGAGG